MSQKYEITHDTAVGQVVFFWQGNKIGVLQDLSFHGTRRPSKNVPSEDIKVYEPMPREHWTIHFTSPALKVELVEAVMEAIRNLPSDLKRMPE